MNYRGQHNGMAHQRSQGGGSSGYSFGTRDQRAEEVARNSLEQVKTVLLIKGWR
jgi:hypothetical protein